MRNKLIKPQDLYIGQLVVTSTHSEAQVRTVAEIYGPRSITIMWYEGTRQCGQQVNAADWYTPTLKQIEYSIRVFGRLASTNDIKGE
jgi:hypothetical protein